MKFKFFTDKNTKQSVAVNKENVLYVYEFGLGPKIVFIDGSYIIVTDPYLDVVAALNSD